MYACVLIGVLVASATETSVYVVDVQPLRHQLVDYKVIEKLTGVSAEHIRKYSGLPATVRLAARSHCKREQQYAAR